MFESTKPKIRFTNTGLYLGFVGVYLYARDVVINKDFAQASSSTSKKHNNRVDYKDNN